MNIDETWFISRTFIIDLREVVILRKVDDTNKYYIYFYLKPFVKEKYFSYWNITEDGRDEKFKECQKILLELSKQPDLDRFKQEIRDIIQYTPPGLGYQVVQSDFEIKQSQTG